MEVKLVRVSSDVHRLLAIQAATRGETIQAITERAIGKELTRMQRRKLAVAGSIKNDQPSCFQP